MATGFTKWQFEILKALLLNCSPLALLVVLLLALLPTPLSALLAALQLYTVALLELLYQQLIPAPIFASVLAQRCPLSLSIKIIEEVELKQIYKPLYDIQLMRKKLGALKMMRISWLPFDKIRIKQPTKFGGSKLYFSRDKDLNVQYTTILNTYTNELVIQALPYQAQRYTARCHYFVTIQYRPVLIISRVQILTTFFNFFDFLTFQYSF